ncbi:hypothetical protein ACFYY3_01060 [Streptomyces sp. NPDC001812]|uniref:hypothetical protein n=1 Tax=Streptomyces sp. NPDC001812 TaxID=3364611 RepID=UPI0036B0AC74
MSSTPGQWPIEAPSDLEALAPTAAEDDVYVRLAAEKARRELVCDSIRAHLAEQPTTRAVRACERRWHHYLSNLADSVLAERQNQEQAE